MSIKDLFGKSSEKVVTSQEVQKLYDEAESEGYLEEISKDNQRFLPAIDFSSASNFAKYGSAEKYYSDAIKNIYQRYPYDGSRKEKLEWRNNSSQFDLYVFDNIYPKSAGFVTLNAATAQYIFINGGPHTSSTGKFADANIFDTASNRESNLAINPLNLGNTLEFWYKEANNASSSYALFDLWNGVASNQPNYTRFLLEKKSTGFAITYASGSRGVSNANVVYSHDITAWHHYAFTVNSASNGLEIKLYVDGDLKKEITTGSAFDGSADNASSVAYIGAYRTGTVAYSSGSYDEFRFWKEARSSKNISRYWFTNVGGGSNTDDSNTELGVYFKFNEGIISTDSINTLDSKCLDYSGRISNGTIANYSINVRSTGSAIEEFNSSLVEEKDPILYPINSLVAETLDIYTNSGSLYDIENNSNIFKSLPSWIVEEDENSGGQELSNLVQIISSYFDTLHLQIESLPRIKDVKYYKETEKPLPFINKILSSYDFENIEIFNDSTFIEDVLSRNETSEFENKLADIKNTIYQNIYNNLTYIYKSKGTEKSLRNLIRCFGVDDELIKINLYADNAVYEIKDKYTYTSIPKKFVDFNDPDRNSGVIYQYAISGDSNTRGYIKGNSSNKLDYVPVTVQAEIIFPKKPSVDDPNYSIPNFTEVSLFGVHTANSNQSLLSWGNDEFNFKVYAQKRDFGSKDAYFAISGSLSGSGFHLSSSYFNDLYENNKWNLAVRIKPEKLENTNLITGSATGSYILEFVGYNSVLDSTENYFVLSASINESDAKTALSKNKRVYAGAHYQNFDTSSLLASTDVKISSVRFWLDYLSDDELKAHSYDPSSFGRQYPYWNAFLTNKDANTLMLSKADLLALNWDFNTVTSSNAQGEFTVEDVSSGSVAAALEYNFGWLGDIVKYRHSGFAKAFYPNDTQVTNKEYVYAAKLQNPEVISNSELIQIRDTDDINVTRNSKPITYFYSIEKSMSQIINDEIMSWFATIHSFNNLIGDPSERYRKEYKNLSYLRKLFFEKVRNEPDFEKFIEFFKWIDSSISLMINQLIPASANVSDNVRNIIESHLLERNKYENKLPTLEKKGEPVTTTTNPLRYKYEEQVAANNPTGSMWLKQRVERTNPLVSSGDADVDRDREQIRKVIFGKNLNQVPKQYDTVNEVEYQGKEDIVRAFSNIGLITSSLLENPVSVINPLKVQNIPFNSTFTFASESLTASGQILTPDVDQGNYFNKYEYVQTSGRTNTNIGLNEIIDTINLPSPNPDISGVVDRALPTRPTVKTVIVERFSAPGGAEVISRGALEHTGEELSPYNELNNRNYVVRRNLNRLYAETSSINEERPSLHKVNKNSFKQFSILTSDDANIGTKTKYDNQFIVHQIPRSDSQYLWISSSLTGNMNAGGYITDYDNLTVYSQGDYTSSLAFLSASSGSLTAGGLGAVADFIGLNTNVIINVNTASNTISPLSSLSGNLNTYLLAKDGPYGMASWKQIRNADKRILKLSRKNNKILVQDPPKQKSKIEKQRVVFYKDRISDTFTSYKEPPVQFNAPMTHLVAVTGSENPVEILSTYDNNKDKLANDSLTKILGAKERTEPQTNDILSELENGLYEPRPKILRKTYAQNIFPKRKDITTYQVRSKPNYEETDSTASVVDVNTFWKDDVKQREKISGSFDLYGFAKENLNNLPSSRTMDAYANNFYPRNDFEGSFTINQNKTYKNSIFSLDSYNDYDNSTVSLETSSILSDLDYQNISIFYSGSMNKLLEGLPFDDTYNLTSSVYDCAVNNYYYLFGGKFATAYGQETIAGYNTEAGSYFRVPSEFRVIKQSNEFETTIYKVIPYGKNYFFAFGNFDFIVSTEEQGGDVDAPGVVLYYLVEPDLAIAALTPIQGALLDESATEKREIRTAITSTLHPVAVSNFGLTTNKIIYVGGNFSGIDPAGAAPYTEFEKFGFFAIDDYQDGDGGYAFKNTGTKFGTDASPFHETDTRDIILCIMTASATSNGIGGYASGRKGIVIGGRFIGNEDNYVTGGRFEGPILYYPPDDDFHGIGHLANGWKRKPDDEFESYFTTVASICEDSADNSGSFFIAGNFPNNEGYSSGVARWNNVNQYYQYLDVGIYLWENIDSSKDFKTSIGISNELIVNDILSNSSGLYAAASSSYLGTSYILRYNTTSRATFSGSWSVVKALTGSVQTLENFIDKQPTVADPDVFLFGGSFDRTGNDYKKTITLQDSDKFRGYLNNITFLETDYNRRRNIQYTLNNLSYYDISRTNIYKLNGRIDDSFSDTLKTTSSYAFISSSEGLYVAGNFSIVCGSVANGIARYHGGNFNRLTASGGAELFNTPTSNDAPYVSVKSICSSSHFGLVAAGAFTTSSGGNFGGNANYNRIARWKDNQWIPFYSSSQPNDEVYQVITASYDNRTYIIAVGAFDEFDGSSATKGIAAFIPESSSWYGGLTFFGEGVFDPKNYPVRCIASSSLGIFIGGDFTGSYRSNSNSTFNYIKRFTQASVGFNSQKLINGAVGIGSGTIGIGGPVYSIALSPTASNGVSEVFIGGNFTTAGGKAANNIVKYNGGTFVPNDVGGVPSITGSFTALGTGLNGPVYTMISTSTGLYVGGEFTKAGNTLVNNIARWSNNTWNVIGRDERNGFNLTAEDKVLGLTMVDNKLYIAGQYLGTRSGPVLKDRKYSRQIEGYSGSILMPKPQLIFNNFIPPSVGITESSGMRIDEVEYNSDSNTIKKVTQYRGQEFIHILNNGYVYEIEEISGKKPFFDSYSDYAIDFKPMSQKYSVIPEYKISSYVEKTIKEKNGNFTTILKEDYLSYRGFDENIKDSNNINNNIVSTDTIRSKTIFENVKNNENLSLKIKTSAIKKLRPEKNFYPSDYILQLSNYFLNSFLLSQDNSVTSSIDADEKFSSVLSNGTPIDRQALALMQPLFSPGILLNTIKASIAVDFPTFIANSGSFSTKPGFYSNSGSSLIKETLYDAIALERRSYSGSFYIDSEFNFRFPFESLVEFDTIIPEQLKNSSNNLYYLNPTYYSSDTITGSDYTDLAFPLYNMGTGSVRKFMFTDSVYKLAMHNFLAEVPNFFLNEKLNNFKSSPETEFKTAISGTTYFMDVVLEAKDNFTQFFADPYQEGLKTIRSNFRDGVLLLPSADSLYGPPTRYWQTNTYDIFYSPYNYFFKLIDTPSYAPYVPPYYYGKAVGRISFLADETRNYTLAEIQSKAKIEYINEELENLFAERSSFLQNNFTAPVNTNYKNSPAYTQRMNLSASINLLLKKQEKNVEHDSKTSTVNTIKDRENNSYSWVIQTKYETPSINFINSRLSGNLGLRFIGGEKLSSGIRGFYEYLFKGMWTTYGSPTKSGEGIDFYIQNSFTSSQNAQGRGTGSLIDLCGFEKDEKRTIGLVGDNKSLQEGVLMIPYTFIKNHGGSINRNFAETLPEILGENGIYDANSRKNGPYYYKIDREVLSKALGLSFDKNSKITFEEIKSVVQSDKVDKNNSIVKLVNSLTNYVIPPHLDWLRNLSIDPFVMYIAEFSTRLERDDLSDIWQGLMPKSSYTTELEDFTISHPLTKNDLFHGLKPEPDTRMKLFKVKKKAGTNYYELIEDSPEDSRFKFKNFKSKREIPKYSFNYPYDFCSLVEMVNVEIELEAEKEENN